MNIANVAIVLTLVAFLGMIIYVTATIDKDPIEKKKA